VRDRPDPDLLPVIPQPFDYAAGIVAATLWRAIFSLHPRIFAFHRMSLAAGGGFA